jgi:hypothetical protein
LGFASVLDESKIPNLKNVMESMIKPLRDITKGTLSAVPYDWADRHRLQHQAHQQGKGRETGCLPAVGQGA